MLIDAETEENEIFIDRTEEVLEPDTDIIATACPSCIVMLNEGLKYKNEEEAVKNLDIADSIVEASGL